MCFYMVLDSVATSYIGWPPPAFVSICDARFSFLLTMQRYYIFRQVPNFGYP